MDEDEDVSMDEDGEGKNEAISSDEASELEEEDKIIARLEKKLGVDKKKNNKLGDDELDGLLEGITSANRGTKRKRGADVASSKKRNSAVTPQSSEEETGSEDEESDLDLLEGEKSESDISEDSTFKGFSSASEPSPPSTAALTAAIPTGKYVPPAARKAAQPTPNNPDQDPHLRKQLQGTLNRLSESNISTILTEIEALYLTHPRAHVTSLLTDLLLTILSAQQALLDTFVILHAGFVAALYRVIGLDFGACLVQTLIERFDVVYGENGKEASNLIVFLGELYNFGVVGCTLVYDLIRMFLEGMTEVDTELLLKIIQSIFPLCVMLMMRFRSTVASG